MPDAAYSDPGDFWLVGATLLGKTDPGTTQTSGALTSPPVAGSATETTTGDPTITGAIDFTATRSGTWTGYVVGSAGRRDMVVNNSFDLSTVSGIALTNSSSFLALPSPEKCSVGRCSIQLSYERKERSNLRRNSEASILRERALS